MSKVSLLLVLPIFFLNSSLGFGGFLPKPRFDGRIVGGVVVEIEKHPHQVSLQYFGGHICGGSIINESWVLTAAHCTDGSSANNFKVRIGSQASAKGGELIQVKRIVQNEKYDRRTIDFDFSLLELSEKINFDQTKQPIRLPPQDNVLKNGTLLVVSGWGNTQNWQESNALLRAAVVPAVDFDSCNRAYKSFGGITPRMVCAGYDKGGKDACQGDSGGPLSADGVLYGVVSWGYGCAVAGYPGVYSNVASVRDWIESVIFQKEK